MPELYGIRFDTRAELDAALGVALKRIDLAEQGHLSCGCPCINCSNQQHWMCRTCRDATKPQCHYCFRTVYQDAKGVWRHDVNGRSYCQISVPVKPRENA